MRYKIIRKQYQEINITGRRTGGSQAGFASSQGQLSEDILQDFSSLETAHLSGKEQEYLR